MNNLIEIDFARDSQRGQDGVRTRRLTAREMEVLSLVAEDPGVPNKMIAWKMGGLSPHTVRALLRSSFREIGVRSRWEVPAWMREIRKVAA